MLTCRTLAVAIDCPSGAVYEFVSNPENLPRWATALCGSVRRSGGDWVMETPQGPATIRFVARNDFGVLDHVVTLARGVDVRVPMRVIANGDGAELLFTLFRAPGMSEQAFAEDAAFVERDLGTLKRVLEERERGVHEYA